MVHFGPTLFLLYINNLDDAICDIAIYADDTTLYSKCDQVSDLWQQLELASEFESYLQETVDWGKKWLVDFSAGKTQLVLFERSNNNGSIDVSFNLFFCFNFFLLRLLCISIIYHMPSVWNTVVTSGPVPLVATWNC